MIIRTILALAVVTTCPLAQDVPAQSTENIFYRAFYLERGERRSEAALELYRKFLAAAPTHRYAGRAARNAFAILDRSGRTEEAQELKKTFVAHFGAPAAKQDTEAKDTEAKDADAKDAAAKDEAGGAAVAKAPAGERAAVAVEERAEEPRERGRDRDAEADEGQLSAEDKERLQERVQELEKRLAEAEKDGDERVISRVERQIERAKEQLETGRRPSRREGRRGDFEGRPTMNFAEMSDEEITGGLERIERFRGRMLEMLRERGDDERADEAEKQWKAMKRALDDGKKDKAQEIFDEMMRSIRRRR